MSKQGYSNLRISDLGGGMDRYRGDSEIDNNQGVTLKNFQVEGNKLEIIPGYSLIAEPEPLPSIARGVKGMANWGEFTFVMNRKCFLVLKGQDVAGYDPEDLFTASGYTLVPFVLGDLYVAVIATDGSHNVKIYKINKDTGTIISLLDPVGLTDGKFTCGTFYNGRLILGGNPSAPATIHLSRTASVTNPSFSYDFSGTGSASQVVGDGSAKVTAFTTRQNEIYVVTRNAFWKSSETDSSYNLILRKETSTGAPSQKAVTTVLQDIVYFDGLSVRRLSYEENTLALKDASISDPILPLIQALPSSQDDACGGFSYPYYKLSLRSQSSSSNSTSFVYNVIRKSWSIQDLGMSSSCNAILDGRPTLIFGTSNSNKIYKEEKTSRAFDEGAISSEFVSKSYTFGDDADLKRVSQVEMMGKISSLLTVYVDLMMDGKVYQTREIKLNKSLPQTTGSSTIGGVLAGSNGEVDDMEGFVFRFETWMDGREFQFRIRSNGYGNFSLSGVNVTYKFLKNYPLHY